jgi:Arc/MetJ family transcription regulator
MRTTLDLDGKLLREAMSLARAKTKKETVERSLREFIRTMHLERLIARRGAGTTLTVRTLSRLRRDA